ncbi:SUMF1/EgtB/PvdO family nonheme iron enzyme [Adhaeribacter terreus]|uniref:SUMF1/EgtB/PvdO family nonheme iron enzyme n=2 Tax=Adhaeribacter terreus TaxID=529703 RepID=A0ABW0E934_9BACT
MLLSILTLWLSFFPFLRKQEIVPPGTVRFQENRYIDTEVISNFEWMVYLYKIKNDSTAAFYKSMLPDTSQIINGKNKYSNPKFADIPLTGISEFQALTYCKWRSNFVSNNIIDSKNICLSGQREYAKFDKVYKVVYRLPTPEELKTVSGMPKKVKPARNFEEMTSDGNVVVTDAFTRKAVTKNVSEAAALNRTFRCVAYFEKR